MNNQSLRARLGIEDKNYPMASRIIKDTLDAKLIKEENPDGGARHNYVPYWAQACNWHVTERNKN